MNIIPPFILPSGYSVAVVLHVAGVLGLGALLAREWSHLRRMRSGASPERVMAAMRHFKSARKMSLVFTLTTGLSGSYLMATHTGPVAWSVTSVPALILTMVLAVGVTGPRVKAVGRALAAGRATDARTMRGLTGHPLLWVSTHTRAAVIAAVVLLKFARPGLGGSLLTIGVAIVVGVASALPLGGFARARLLPPASTRDGEAPATTTHVL